MMMRKVWAEPWRMKQLIWERNFLLTRQFLEDCRDPKFAEFYKEVLKADDKTLKMVSNGYIVPFDSEPPPTI